METGYTTESMSYDNLIAGDFPVITGRAILVSGQNLTRGAALGKITASGKLKQLDSASSDGSENAYAILVEDSDASGGDAYCTIYLSGEFNQNAVGFVSGDTAADFADQFRAISIFLKNALAE